MVKIGPNRHPQRPVVHYCTNLKESRNFAKRESQNSELWVSSMSEELIISQSATIRHTMMYGVSSQRSGDKYLPSICSSFSSVDNETSLAKEEFKGDFAVDMAEIWTSRIRGIGCVRRYFGFRFIFDVRESESLFSLVRNDEIDDCNGVLFKLVGHSSNGYLWSCISWRTLFRGSLSR